MNDDRRKQTTVRVDNELIAELMQIKVEDGVPIAESVRRAIKDYLERRKGDAKHEASA